jgi:HEAT repeat protein
MGRLSAQRPLQLQRLIIRIGCDMTKAISLVIVAVVILIPGGNGGKLPTLDEQLRDFHIGVTGPDLRDALRNDIPEVRGLAADKLAEIDEPDAIKYIEVALVQETVPRIAVEMAFALARMKDTKGIEVLTHMCNDTSLNSLARMKASRYVVALRRLTCLDATLTLADSRGRRRRQNADRSHGCSASVATAWS